MASIKVAVRVRPPSKREHELGCRFIIHMEGQRTFITNIKLPSCQTSPALGDEPLSSGRERIKQFTYDYSYWSVSHKDKHYCSQQQVYHDLGVDVVNSAYEGYNACVFAYGQTGSGKTYTMMGSHEDMGLIPRICENLFCRMSDEDTTYRCEVSYLEIYNERVRDLLRDRQEKQEKQTQNLRVREHPKTGPYVQDLSKHLVMSNADIQGLMERGNSNRTTAATSMNDASSRSHAIFSIVFTQARFSEGLPSEIHSKINLVDLAGSERADASGATGERLKEGGSINKSLVTLGNVISTLADLSDKLAAARKSVFIPYRDSVLTWLLKDSLGGNSRTIMIATISPADCNYGETLSTLRYASRAKKIINKPTINEDPNVKLIRELREENARLRALLGENMDLGATQEKLYQNEAKMKRLTEKWTDKWHEAAIILQEHKTLALRKEGPGVVLDSELPHLILIEDNNIFTTGMTLYHLKEGQTRLGALDEDNTPDIILRGQDVKPVHCIIENINAEVTLLPNNGALVIINNVLVQEPTKLNQGAVLRLGRTNMFRFNHPGEAAKLRAEMGSDFAGYSMMAHLWSDFQWTWSGLASRESTPDIAAAGSEVNGRSASVRRRVHSYEARSRGLKTREQAEINRRSKELEELEERKQEIAKLEEEHCLAEANRLAQLAEQESSLEELQEKEQSLLTLEHRTHSMKVEVEKAQKEIKRLSSDIEKQFIDQMTEKERLHDEELKINREKERLEREKVRKEAEQARLVRQTEFEVRKEKAKMDVQQQRQKAEWEQLNIERQVVDKLRKEDMEKVQREKVRLERERQLEKEIYEKESEDMRKMIDEEIRGMRELVGMVESACDSRDVKRDSGAFDWQSTEDLAALLQPSPRDSMHQSFMESMSPSPVGSEESDLDAAGVEAKLERLGLQVSDTQVRVCELLYAAYNSNLPSQQLGSTKLQDIAAMFDGIRPLFDELERMSRHDSDATKELPELHSQLRRFDRTLSLLDKFLQVHHGLQDINLGIQNKNFLSVIEILDAIQNLFSAIDVQIDIESRVHKVMQTEVCVQRERLLFELGEVWNRLFEWTLPNSPKKKTNAVIVVKLKAPDPQESKNLIGCVTQAMHEMSMLHSRLKTFTDRIMMYFVEPVVRERSTDVQHFVVMSQNKRPELHVVHRVSGKDNTVPPQEVFTKLECIFSFLHKMWDGIVVHEWEKELGEETSYLTTKFGNAINQRLFQCLFHDCLSHAIPRNDKNWDKFNKVVSLSEQFQNFLMSLKFLPDNQGSLLDYFNNVNSLFANLKSQEMLKKAHEIMTQELAAAVSVSGDGPLGFGSATTGSEAEGTLTDAEQNEIVSEDKVECFAAQCVAQGDGVSKLPSCQISSSVRTLVVLAYESLLGAVNSSEECAVQFYNAVCNMFELFCDVVPTYHAERLSKLPLVAALHYNNCMFAAHHLVVIDKEFHDKFTMMASGTCLTVVKLADLVIRMRKLGHESLREFLSGQSVQLSEYLVGAQGFECVADDEGTTAQRALRQIMHHLQHLSSAWKQALPSAVYYKTMGFLLNGVLKEIIDLILTIHEFSCDDCDQLEEVLSPVTDGTTELFKLEGGKCATEVLIQQYAPSWLKLKELLCLLSANMKDVSDRWASGKGPLALHFTAEEVRHLVRATFENTSKRDTLLSEIR